MRRARVSATVKAMSDDPLDFEFEEPIQMPAKKKESFTSGVVRKGMDHAGGNSTPSEVKAMLEPVAAVSCGGFFTMAFTEQGQLWNWGDKGKLYMWGYATDSQLGVPGLPEIQSTPIEVKFLSEDDGLGDHNSVSVAVGASHGMCLVSRSVSCL